MAILLGGKAKIATDVDTANVPEPVFQMSVVILGQICVVLKTRLRAGAPVEHLSLPPVAGVTQSS